MEYEQREIIFMINEYADAHKIHTRRSDHFDEQTYILGMIQFWVHEIQRDREDRHDERRSERPAFDYIDTKILSILEKAPFESARSIAGVLNVDYAIELHHLRENLP
jgi:hypothetical protein